MPGPERRPLLERFWGRVHKTEACWLFGGKKATSRYYQLSKGPGLGNVLAHRLSFEIHKGAVPRGKFVCHKCDVKNCVNPEHLYAGDHEDNTDDIVSRGRTAKGSARRVSIRAREQGPHENRFGRALSKELRDDLVREYESGKHTQVELAARYRVSQATVSATIRGKQNMGQGGTGKKRTGHYRRKFAPEVLAEIRKAYATGKFTQQQLATRFGCDQTYVSMLVH